MSKVMTMFDRANYFSKNAMHTSLFGIVSGYTSRSYRETYLRGSLNIMLFPSQKISL